MASPKEAVTAFSLANPPPPAPRDDMVVDTYFGHEVRDPYRQMETPDARTLQWASQQEERFAKFTAGVDITRIAQHLTEIYNFPRETPPEHYGSHYFSTYNDGKSPQSTYLVRDSLDGTPRTLIDPNLLDKDGKISLADAYPSPDGKRVAYLTSIAGSDFQTLHIRDVATGKDLPDVIGNCRAANLAWDQDGKGFEYNIPITDEKNNLKRFMLKHHTLGEPVEKDTVTFDLPDGGVTITNPVRVLNQEGKPGAYDLVKVSLGSSKNNAVYIKPAGSTQPYKPLFDDHDTSSLEIIGEVNGMLYAVTNLNASKGRVVAIDPARPQPENWKTIVPEQAQDVITSGQLYKNRLMIIGTHDTASRISMYDTNGTFRNDIPLPPQTTATLGDAVNADDRQVQLFVSGFTSPGDTYQYDLETGSLALRQKTQAKLDPAFTNNVIVERVYATSKDGSKVPMTIMHRKDVKMDGTAVVEMYGYGGFNAVKGPSFNFESYNFVKEGGIYVQANLRGDGGFGAEWYHQGQKQNKQHTFDDLAACAEYLENNHYTSPPRLAIKGASNGGLTMLATALQRPELFGAVIAEKPVTDLYRFDLFGVGKGWQADYGKPRESEADFNATSQYIPLYNIKEGGKYPSILLKTAENDNRVSPFHALKFAAAFQNKADPGSLLVMHVEKAAGHGGVSGTVQTAGGITTEQLIGGITQNYAFMVRTLGPINQDEYKIQRSLDEIKAHPPAPPAAASPPSPPLVSENNARYIPAPLPTMNTRTAGKTDAADLG